MFLDHTQRRTTVGRAPLDKRSARRRDLYLTTHDTHKRQISMPPVGVEPTISVSERPATAHLLILEKHSNIKFREHPSNGRNGAELYHADGRTEGQIRGSQLSIFAIL
jgi:hypothetical protein